MPISRYHIPSPHGLADPELHRAADKDDSEALLEAVAMTGIVGLLRQLGDLSQFAGELFHNLHEEVMATAERGHSLKSRVQQLEAEIPVLEKAFLSQTHHSSFFTNRGIDWHPNLRSEQNLVTCGDLPRFILDSYEECRGPPRLFLLDKFDVAGAGACLKRYTDPSLFKAESASSVTAAVRREKRILKLKKKGARLRNGEAAKFVSSHSKLHQLFLEERIENAFSDPARLVKLRKKQLGGSAVQANTGKSYMEKILEMPSPDHKMVCETSIIPLPVKPISDDTSEIGIKILDINSTSPVRSLRNPKTSPNEQKLEMNSCSEIDRKTNGYLVNGHEHISASMTDEMSSNHLKAPVETELADDEQKKRECSLDGYVSDDAISEVDDYKDALATIDSDLETDNECRPKKILLNVQKVTDSNAKEHQLQAPFLDPQSSRDSSISEEIERDQNEVQAWLPDSQSAGTRCESDDNCSFKRGINEEHTWLQAQFSDSQSIGNSSSENENIPSDQLPQTVELQKTSGEFVTCEDAHDQEEIIPDSSPVSSGSCLMDSGCLFLPSDSGATSLMSLPTRTQSDETPPVPVELHFKSEDGEDRTCLVESIAAESYAPSPIKHNTCPDVSFDNNSLSNLDICDPYVHSNLHSSSDLNMVHDSDCGDHSDNKMVQAESLNEYSSVIAVVGDIGSQGEDPICLAMEDELNSGSKLLLEDQNLNSEEDIIKTQLNSEYSFPVVETTLESSFIEDPICLATEDDLNSGTKLLHDDQILNSVENIVKTQLNLEDLFPLVETTLESSFTEELCSDLTHGNPQDLPDLAEVEVLYPVQQSNFEEIPRVMPGHEINGSTCSLDPDEDDGHINHPPSSDYLRQDNPGMVTDMFSVKVQSEDQAVIALPCVEIAENHESNVHYLAPTNLSSLHEPFLGSSDSHQMQMESNEVELTKKSIDLNAEKMENQLVPSSEILSSPMSSLTRLEESLTSFADPLEKKMEVSEAGARESFTELSAHQVVDQPEIASTDELVNRRRSVPYFPSGSGINNNVQHSALEEKIQYGSSLNDMNMVTGCSKLDSQRSESMFVLQYDLQNSNNCLSPPSCNQLKSETHSHLLLKSQALLRNEENSAPAKFQPQLMQISNQLEQERISHAASEFAAELHPDENSRGSSSQSSAQQINSSEHIMDPLKPLLPDLFPKATKINLEETPPMPPLPPMQWIMSKVQNASEVSQREEIDVGQVSCQPIKPVKPDYRSEFGLSPSKRVTFPYQSPFSPVVVAVESNKLLHSSVLSEAVSEHPVGIPLQFPLTVNEVNDQHHYLSQTQNPFLTLPVVSSVTLPLGSVIASEEESVLNSTSCPPILPAECAVSNIDPNFQQEKPTQSSNQLLEDTSLEPKKDRTEELHLVLPAECPVSGDDPSSPKEKSAQPPNQLLEESNLEVKALEQCSINLERKHENPLITPMSPPSVEIVQTNHSPVPSEGELVLSIDTSPQSSEFDSEMSNGKPKNKLPHPPNPLVDIAAALDKSRLRKASDRVRPDIAPKVDERDSLLEQIRSKSFNLKPAMVKRPSIQGPRTNLRVAAILEKANAIRQAFAGSDEDDDADSWSDS